eukprot:5384868-Prymnesium_polylepis.1
MGCAASSPAPPRIAPAAGSRLVQDNAERELVAVVPANGKEGTLAEGTPKRIAAEAGNSTDSSAGASDAAIVELGGAAAEQTLQQQQPQRSVDSLTQAEMLPLVAHIRKVGHEAFASEMKARYDADALVTRAVVREGLIAHLGASIVGADAPDDGSGVLGMLLEMLTTRGHSSNLQLMLQLWRAWCKSVAKPVRALLIIDVQNDFIDGTLALKHCPAGQDAAVVVPVINRMRETVPFDV